MVRRNRLRACSLISMALICLATVLSGCAVLNTVASDVSSFGQWPEGRAPGGYTIERLPSQQALGQRQDQLEAAARPALERAGFKAATDPAHADVAVQLSARLTQTDVWPRDDPMWGLWGGGLGYGHRHRFGWGAGFDWGWPASGYPEFEREVGLLIRDRATGRLLYEAHASSSGPAPGGDAVLSAMFTAAMTDFPHTMTQPHRIDISPEGRH